MFEKFSSWLQSVVESKSLDEAITNFISTKYGQYALIFIFFMFIITYLRVLFGPKGFFREKQWDEWNEDAKARREAEIAEREAGAQIEAEKKS
ncbi:hypothetical protein [Halodesulfovibrio marinisediminis]|uniref:Uncharacterized protein n=1 Tax=Halodesulfovibrio marinisediminis DSM 17456 TaxID=1121457 RepID=A0A1N6DN07_9BACT|nr:hypothetical protein [Halodesulfovibrio marinisediminis]SIN72126.1 hypothetical protein SAMN02745161_0327 [Halodesulfovibrio marinisediminis DSM 17456]